MGDRLRTTKRSRYVTSQLSHENQLRLERQKHGSSYSSRINAWCAGKTVKSLDNACHTTALLRWASQPKALYRTGMWHKAVWSAQCCRRTCLLYSNRHSGNICEILKLISRSCDLDYDPRWPTFVLRTFNSFRAKFEPYSFSHLRDIHCGSLI